MFVELEFEKGALVVARAKDRPTVVIAPARESGEVGTDASAEEPLVGGLILRFPTNEQADAVATALGIKLPDCPDYE